MQNKEKFIGQKTQDDFFKLIVNTKGDFIYLDDKDPLLFDKYADFLKWLDDKDKEIQEKGKEILQRYGENAIISDDNGNIKEFDIDAILEISKFRISVYREAAKLLNDIFGGDIIRKYFFKSYEINPDFVPGDECLYEFLEEITEVMNEIFAERKERLEGRYNNNRKGGSTTKYRTGK